jgi:hypothetical protein
MSVPSTGTHANDLWRAVKTASADTDPRMSPFATGC